MSPVPERAKLHIAMVVFQTGYAGNPVIMRFALNLGVSKLVFPLYRTIIALSVLAPSAFFLEKNERPAMNTSFLIQFFLLGLVGITLNQGFYIFGLDNTSPTFASVTENVVPAVSFLMAVLLGIEKVELKRRDGIAKMVGTFVSVAGSLVITLYKGPTIYQPSLGLMDQPIKFEEAEEQNKNWTLGCFCLMGHCLCWSSWIVLQSPLLKKYPARFSFISYSCFFAVLQFFGISAYFERDIQSWKISSLGVLYALLYTGLVGSAMVFAIQIYVVERGGPLFVSAYLPLQTLIAALLATFALGEHFYLGGLIGAILIICGLYLVVMGKSWERQTLCQNMILMHPKLVMKTTTLINQHLLLRQRHYEATFYEKTKVMIFRLKNQTLDKIKPTRSYLSSLVFRRDSYSHVGTKPDQDRRQRGYGDGEVERKKKEHDGLFLHKSKGQHLLTNTRILDAIVRSSDIRPTDTVLEIGPGTGNLTMKLLEAAQNVVAVELDKRMVEILRKRVSDHGFEDKLTIIQKDVLKTDFPPFDLVVANIPYNISSPLIAKLVYGSNTFRTATLLLQKEFSRRLLANPGDSDFNRLAVNVKLVADVKFIMDVSKREFVPPPKVDSSVVMIRPKEVKLDVNVQEWLAFTRTCFGKKNKTLGSMFRQKKKIMELLSLSAGRIGSKVGVMSQMSRDFDSDVEEDELMMCLDTDASMFKERVIGILRSNGFEEKRPSKLSHDELLHLLSLFNQGGIFFHDVTVTSLPQMDLHE
ncbi:unnamed protein product [Arabis nemorensis]|uniref:Ribosomal RNA adenine methylase transferase N-terminal domain-containing protein n=1 Tax=Arabis nemorensis TaxID=586526 RepID=A0A565CXL1_9BRAS|nr:unnamed protein product [Arabis nemorensis]